MNTFDNIYDLLVKRHKQQELGYNTPIIYNESDINELEEFCKKNGILGVNFKNMDPKMILNMLKSKFGMVESPTQSKKVLLKG